MRAIEGEGDGHPPIPAEAAILDLIHDAILVRDPATDTLTYWNRGAEELYGWAAGATQGRPAHALLRTRRMPSCAQCSRPPVPRSRRSWAGRDAGRASWCRRGAPGPR